MLKNKTISFILEEGRGKRKKGCSSAYHSFVHKTLRQSEGRGKTREIKQLTNKFPVIG